MTYEEYAKLPKPNRYNLETNIIYQKGLYYKNKHKDGIGFNPPLRKLTKNEFEKCCQ